jgi:hypothetical protein
MSEEKSPRLHRRRMGEQDDPKMIGLWKIGRTIGKGSQGAFNFLLTTSCPDQSRSL